MTNNDKTLPRFRTIKACLAEIKKFDANTAITESFIRRLCKQNKITYFSSGNKFLVSLDSLFYYLNYTQDSSSK